MAFQKPFKRAKRVTIDTGKGLTEQAHKMECDMNYILRNYQKTGMLRHARENEGRYDDVTSQDFQEAMFIVKAAENMFNGLPANIRKKFSNDPVQFMDFVHNPDNVDEMRKLGLVQGVDGIDAKGVPTGVVTQKPQEPLGEAITPNPT